MKTTTTKVKKTDTIDNVVFNTFWETLSAKQRKILKQVFRLTPISLEDLKFIHPSYHKIVEAYKISSSTYSANQFKNLWCFFYNKNRTTRFVYKQKPKKDKRDNKDVRVGSGSGGSMYSTIRFPKQRANKSVWKKFWKLFPFLENCKSWSEYHEKEAKKNETL